MNEEQAMKVVQTLGRLDERTELILEQTRRTNGRVTALEERVNTLEQGRDKSAGAKEVRSKIGTNTWSLCEKLLILGAGVVFGKIFK